MGGNDSPVVPITVGSPWRCSLDCMYLLDLTLDPPAANLALDEALLEAVQSAKLPAGVLRFWETTKPVVVVGRGSRSVDEVDLAACRRDGVPVLRRISGGMSIFTGPGCLMYSVVDQHPTAKTNIDLVHRHVLDTMAAGLRETGLEVQAAGTSDLAVQGSDGLLRKVSGNSLRIAGGAYLYHGTLLYNFDLSLISRYLNQPPRAPEYRSGRQHAEFVANLSIDLEQLKRAIARAWGADDNLSSWPQDCTSELLASRYSKDAWNLSR